MHVLSSSIESIKLRRAHKKQKRTALRMLALSGVVRSSHVELHYRTPMALAYMTTFRRLPTAIEHQQNYPLPLPSWDHDTTLNMKQSRQWAHNLSSSLVQLANKPILLRWTKQLDL